MPSASNEVRDAYDRWHDALEVDMDAKAPWYELVMAALDPKRDLEGKRVLEIGCGRGDLAFRLIRQFPGIGEFVAADFSESAVRKGEAFARRHGFPEISWRVEDIQNIQAPDSSFDTVVSCETIEHVPDPPLAVRELARVLKPGGRLFLTTPNYLNLMGLYRLYVTWTGREFTEVGQPINQFNLLPRTRSWVRKAGLEVDAILGSGHYIPFPRRIPFRLTFLDHWGILTRGVAFHSLIVSRKG